MPLHSYIPTFVLSTSTRLVRKPFFPALLLQFLVNQLSSVTPDLKGAWPSLSHPNGKRSSRTTYNPSWCKQSLSLSGQTHTHNQAHCTHQDCKTVLFFMFPYAHAAIGIRLQVVFGPLMLIGGTLMFFWFFFMVRADSGCRKCSHNVQLLNFQTLQKEEEYKMHFNGISFSILRRENLRLSVWQTLL